MFPALHLYPEECGEIMAEISIAAQLRRNVVEIRDGKDLDVVTEALSAARSAVLAAHVQRVRREQLIINLR